MTTQKFSLWAPMVFREDLQIKSLSEVRIRVVLLVAGSRLILPLEVST
jgi:hypothetical protein